MPSPRKASSERAHGRARSGDQLAQRRFITHGHAARRAPVKTIWRLRETRCTRAFSELTVCEELFGAAVLLLHDADPLRKMPVH